MKNKTNLVALAAFSLAIAGPVSAANIGYNPAIPLHHRTKASEGSHLTSSRVSTTSLKTSGIQLPDLVIRSASIRLAQSCHAGAPVLYVTARVQNVGHAASAAKLSVGLVQARNARNTSWGNGHGLPRLAAGQATTVSFPVYYLQSKPASMLGKQVFKLRVNAGKWIKEANYTNNGYRPIAVVIPASFCKLQPDITSHKGPRIGGKYVPWGGSVTIGKSNAKRIQNGRCVFDVVYPMSNDSKVSTSPVFINRLRDGRTVSAVNSSLHLNAGETKHLDTEQRWLPGTHVMGLSLDDGNAVKESNEHNNRFRVVVRVDNSCQHITVRPRQLQHLKLK